MAINGTPLAASKSCSLSKSSSFIEVASPTDGSWESFVPAKKGWSMSSDCLLATMDAYKTLDAAWKAGTALTIRFFNTDYNENEVGTAYIESLELTASKGNLAKMSVSLKGSGPLSSGTKTISYSKQILFNNDGRYYKESTSPRGQYYVATSTNGKAYTGTITLSKKTLVRIKTNGDTVLLSQNQALRAMALLETTITKALYSKRTTENTDIWLDAGTWYVVNTNENYTFGVQFQSINETE